MRRTGIMLSASLLWLACSPAEDDNSTQQDEDPAQGDDGDGQTGDDDGDAQDWGEVGNDPNRPDGGGGDGDGDGDDDGPGLDSGVPDSGGPVDDCQPGACCIGGVEFLPGAPNPDNVCQACDPSMSLDAFSPADGANCGAGCTCAAGRATEVLCADAVDNDRDDRLNCADADCGGKLCQASTVRHVVPSRDLTVSQGPVGGPSEDADEPTLQISVGNAGQSWARFEFQNIPPNSVLDVESAVLNIYVETNNGVRLNLRDPSGNEIGTTTGQGGNRTYDITSLVKRWADGSVTERFVTLHWGNSNRDGVKVRATEHDGEDSDPYIFMTYEAYCNAGSCPVP
jgi:hypothetical protein